MRYSFRLAELIGHIPDPRKRPGTIKAIVDHTGLDRHQVAALLKNEVKYIPLHALSRLCDYLIEHGHVTADQLPGALFAIEPENFWELLARRKRLEFCLGVRRADPVSWPDGAWVVASDSVLLGAMLNGVSTLGGTARHHRDPSAGPQPHPEHLRQTLVWSPGQGASQQVISRASDVYGAFADTGGDKGLVTLGSTKSNPVVELILAGTFGCEPYLEQDEVAEPKDRSCPIYLRFRNDDPQVTSCWGGVQLARNAREQAPGIYYETADGSWAHCRWDENQYDAALVFYVHRESQGRLEMALCGFSGRATRLLARTLSSQAEAFFPPVYDKHGLQIGAFVVEYSFEPQYDDTRDILQTDLVANQRIVPLSVEAISRRLED